VTLFLLWQEYKAAHPEGFQYSWFCGQYRAWEEKLDVVMRQPHRAGEKLFVDYAGQTVEIVDWASGEVKAAQIFVAVLGASNYTYAEASPSQSLPDWLASHVRAFEYFGGTPAIVVPDNLKSGVTKACRYDPNSTRATSSRRHYQLAVVPAALQARDKAKAGWGATRRALDPGPPSHHSFFSLTELNRVSARCPRRQRQALQAAAGQPSRGLRTTG
jgi:transposase